MNSIFSPRDQRYQPTREREKGSNVNWQQQWLHSQTSLLRDLKGRHRRAQTHEQAWVNTVGTTSLTASSRTPVHVLLIDFCIRWHGAKIAVDCTVGIAAHDVLHFLNNVFAFRVSANDGRNKCGCCERQVQNDFNMICHNKRNKSFWSEHIVASSSLTNAWQDLPVALSRDCSWPINLLANQLLTWFDCADTHKETLRGAQDFLKLFGLPLNSSNTLLGSQSIEKDTLRATVSLKSH